MAQLPGKLVVMRHGESTWNAKGEWTGTRDMALTFKGKREAHMLGEAVAEVRFDRAYVSQQQRAKQTLAGVLEASGQPDLPFHVNAAINERDYGIYTGLNKWETQKRMAPAEFHGVHRGFDYPIPNGERLKDVYERSVPFYREILLPQLADGKTLLLVAHGNSIRSLVKYIESISDKGIAEVEMIFGMVLTYRVDAQGRMTDKQTVKIDSPAPPA